MVFNRRSKTVQLGHKNTIYYSIVQYSTVLYRWLYRTKLERERQWEEKGRQATKANWFRKGGFTSIINVPATPGSLLASRVRYVLQETSSPQGLRPGVQERPGRSVFIY